MPNGKTKPETHEIHTTFPSEQVFAGKKIILRAVLHGSIGKLIPIFAQTHDRQKNN